MEHTKINKPRGKRKEKKKEIQIENREEGRQGRGSGLRATHNLARGRRELAGNLV